MGTAGLAEAGYGDQAKVIQDETRQQDAYLDQIAQGLDQLKHGAMAMQVRGGGGRARPGVAGRPRGFFWLYTPGGRVAK